MHLDRHGGSLARRAPSPADQVTAKLAVAALPARDPGIDAAGEQLRCARGGTGPDDLSRRRELRDVPPAAALRRARLRHARADGHRHRRGAVEPLTRQAVSSDVLKAVRASELCFYHDGRFGKLDDVVKRDNALSLAADRGLHLAQCTRGGMRDLH
jgi:hypothetical protein